MSSVNLLIIGYVWPEPSSSAAGLRDRDLVEAARSVGWRVTFASSSTPGDRSLNLAALGVETRQIAPNDPAFDRWIVELQPDVVVFDRFVVEEQFGWRVREHCPRALRVIDAQDLHFLRRAREAALAVGRSYSPFEEPLGSTIGGVDVLREISAVYRSDLTWVLSDFEKRLLVERYQVNEERVRISRFAYPHRPGPAPGNDDAGDDGDAAVRVGPRSGFAVLGNFRHPPNRDGVFWLKKEIWPRIRARLPDARVDVYGAYPSREVMALDEPMAGFHVRGVAETPDQVFRAARVNLAPLRFGAGIKGKITDGWHSGVPVVTTPIGAEGMSEGLPWGGLIAGSEEEFADAAVRLHEDSRLWGESVRAADRIMRSIYDRERVHASIIGDLGQALESSDRLRANDLIGAMLWHHQYRSTEFFSRWIELKERQAQAQSRRLRPST